MASKNAGWLTRAAETIEANRLIWATQLGPLFLTIAAVLPGLYTSEIEVAKKLGWVDGLLKLAPRWWVLVTISIAIFSIYGGYLGARRQKELVSELQQLKQDNDEGTKALSEARSKQDDAEAALDFLRQEMSATLNELIGTYLCHQSESLAFASDQDRVSLYLHSDSQFYLVGRYSSHPEYRKPNRQKFPDREGCVGRAWLHGGEFFCPDANSYGSFSPLSDESASQVRMGSVMFYCKALQSHHQRIGMIVFESKRVNSLPLDKIRSAVSTAESYLADFLDTSRKVNQYLVAMGGEVKNG